MKTGYPDLAPRLEPQYLLIPREKDDSFPCHFQDILGGEKVRLSEICKIRF